LIENGTVIQIQNFSYFETVLLPLVCKLKSFAAFSRQLNSHGFIKTDRYISQSNYQLGFEQASFYENFSQKKISTNNEKHSISFISCALEFLNAIPNNDAWNISYHPGYQNRTLFDKSQHGSSNISSVAS